MSRKNYELEQLEALKKQNKDLYANADQDKKYKIKALTQSADNMMYNLGLSKRNRRAYEIEIEKIKYDILNGKDGYDLTSSNYSDRNFFGEFEEGKRNKEYDSTKDNYITNTKYNTTNSEIRKLANETAIRTLNIKPQASPESASTQGVSGTQTVPTQTQYKGVHNYDWNGIYNADVAAKSADNQERYTKLKEYVIGALKTAQEQSKQNYQIYGLEDKLNNIQSYINQIQRLPETYNQDSYLAFLDILDKLGVTSEELNEYFPEQTTPTSTPDSLTIGDIVLKDRELADYRDNGYYYFNDPSSANRGVLLYNGKKYNSLSEAQKDLSSAIYDEIYNKEKQKKDQAVSTYEFNPQSQYSTVLRHALNDQTYLLDLSNYYNPGNYKYIFKTGTYNDDPSDFSWYNNGDFYGLTEDGQLEKIENFNTNFNWLGRNYTSDADAVAESLKIINRTPYVLDLNHHPTFDNGSKQDGSDLLKNNVHVKGGGEGNDLSIMEDANGNIIVAEGSGDNRANRSKVAGYYIDNWENPTGNKFIRNFYQNHANTQEKKEYVLKYIFNEWVNGKITLTDAQLYKLQRLLNPTPSKKQGGILIGKVGLAAPTVEENSSIDIEKAMKSEATQHALAADKGWTTNDTIRAIELTGQLASMFGGPTGLAAGVASTLTGAVADFRDDNMSTKDALKELGSNLLMDLAGTIPGAKLAKLGKLGKVAAGLIIKGIQTGAIVNGGMQAVEDFKQWQKTNSKEDLVKFISSASHVLAGVGKGARSVKFNSKYNASVSKSTFKSGDIEMTPAQYKKIEKQLSSSNDKTVKKGVEELKKLGVKDVKVKNAAQKLANFKQVTTGVTKNPHFEYNSEGKLVLKSKPEDINWNNKETKNWLWTNRRELDFNELPENATYWRGLKLPHLDLKAENWFYNKQGGKLNYKNIF